MSTPLKPIVKNDTLSLKLFGTSESSQEILVDAEDIVDEANPRDLSDLVELEEEIEDATNQLLADYEHSEEQVRNDWNTRTSLVLDSSKDALAKRTLSGYKSLYQQFLIYVEARDGQKGLDNINNVTVCCPQYIAEWIINSCENPQDLSLGAKPFKKASLATKKFIDSSGTRDRVLTYSHALKMRAAVSYWFAYLGPTLCSNDPWLRTKSGDFQGNPSLSPMVSRYMRALQKKKSQGGEVAIAARAITAANLERLFNYNQKIPQQTFGTKLLYEDLTYNWGGYRCRKMLHCIYTLAFTCLLRFDEVLQIQHHHIKVIDKEAGKIELNLLFRKTNQYGGIKPFYLFMDVKEPHLDPVFALLEWMHVSQIKQGYLFRRINANDQVVLENQYLTPSTFTEYFRHNLLDISLDFRLYGTHSFRRGGCQWLYTVRNWKLDQICDWGGWSMAFDAMTIIRYLYNFADDPRNLREDYMNPQVYKKDRCYHCGRDCSCSSK